MFAGILPRDLARDFRVVFRELAPLRVSRNQFAGGKELKGATLRESSTPKQFLHCSFSVLVFFLAELSAIALLIKPFIW